MIQIQNKIYWANYLWCNMEWKHISCFNCLFNIYWSIHILDGFSGFFNAIFCYSFILNYVFYNSQLLFVEAIIHLRKTIFHIPNLRNKNDSSHPKYVSEMKKKSFRCPFSVLYSFFIGSLRHTYVQNIYHQK